MHALGCTHMHPPHACTARMHPHAHAHACRTTWDQQDTLTENYLRNALVADPNQLLGRKEKATPLVAPEARRCVGVGRAG